MTVPVQESTRTEAVGNGIATIFAFDFLCLLDQDLQVTVDGLPVDRSQYTVSGLGDAQGGEVMFLSAPANGAPILMELAVVPERETDYQDNGDLFAGTVNFDFDRIWLALQAVGGRLLRALQLGAYDIDGSGAYRANKNRITDLGDPQADMDAVNWRSMFSWATEYVDKAIAGVSGGFGWFQQTGIGAIFRTFQGKMRDTISVLDYITTPVDGVTSNQAGIESAVAAALARGARLLWPDGTYVSTASIPGFHAVQHTGDGRIKRGEVYFYITPKGSSVKNTFHYSILGNDTNDGLSSDAARRTLADIPGLLNQWSGGGNMLDGRWRFLFDQGEWVDERIRINCNVNAKYDVEFEGVLAGDGEPLTIWRHTSSAEGNDIVWIEPGGHYSFRNFYLKGVDNTEFAAYGILQKQGGRLSCYDCRVDGKSIGFAVINNVQGYFARCWAINCQHGFRAQYSSIATVGDAPSTTCRALNCTLTGTFISRNSTAHVDYFNPEDCGKAGLQVDMLSRVNAVGGNYKRCAIGVLTEGAAEFVNNGINFNVGTADACPITFRSSGAGGETRLYCTTSQVEHRCAAAVGDWSTSSTSYVQLTNALNPINGSRLVIPNGWFVDTYKTILVKVWGTRVGTAGAKYIRLTALNDPDSSNPQHLFAVSVGSGAGDFYHEIYITATGVNTQQYNRVFLPTNGSPVVGSDTSAVTFSGGDRILRFYGMVDNAADSLSIRRYEVTLVG